MQETQISNDHGASGVNFSASGQQRQARVHLNIAIVSRCSNWLDHFNGDGSI